MCHCNPSPSTLMDGEGEAPTFSDSPTPPACDHTPSPSPQSLEAGSSMLVVTPVENVIPIPVPPPFQGPCCTVVESSTTLRAISEKEALEIEDRIVGAWQQQQRGTGNVIPTIPDGSGSSEISVPSYAAPVMELTWDQQQTQNLEVRGYRMLSVMRAVTMMPNSTVSACLLSSDHIGGELQLVFLISQEEFDSLLSGEVEAEVRPVMVQDVVQSGAQEDGDELEYSNGWVTDRSVVGLEE
ncbi:hypothetical protein BDM02DRAFT_3132514 [Thelephora ganbajun]|uniref:Uncharacterized protein n=1 Tax=Thelephora ganbajun TaxID=370292 RepID=A0ACB6Z0S7_THEGA|nr:hypothetical protein BDM02DRAFT_3132514 [Thelephora ganbajun]